MEELDKQILDEENEIEYQQENIRRRLSEYFGKEMIDKILNPDSSESRSLESIFKSIGYYINDNQEKLINRILIIKGLPENIDQKDLEWSLSIDHSWCDIIEMHKIDANCHYIITKESYMVCSALSENYCIVTAEGRFIRFLWSRENNDKYNKKEIELIKYKDFKRKL
jgi:hypothetical protein